ncbi:MAG: low affinity iron permease family protein [Flavobacteriales bacterium]|nr:low affinity iron permease family protein [Flavobacteriales bacterium]MBL0044202.1 low affinity iron permease family protein [Flavobacteriales bacterium]
MDPATFIIAVSVIAVWACTKPLFDYSAIWQLVINTRTTIITFLIQHTHIWIQKPCGSS